MKCAASPSGRFQIQLSPVGRIPDACESRFHGNGPTFVGKTPCPTRRKVAAIASGLIRTRAPMATILANAG